MNKAIETTILVAYTIETTMGGHRPQIICAEVLDEGLAAAVFNEGDEMYKLVATDSRVFRTKRWLKNHLGRA